MAFCILFSHAVFDRQKIKYILKVYKKPVFTIKSIQFSKTLKIPTPTFFGKLTFVYYYTYKKRRFFATIKLYKMSILPLDAFLVLWYVCVRASLFIESEEEKTPCLSVCKRFHNANPFTSAYIFETIIMRGDKKTP